MNTIIKTTTIEEAIKQANSVRLSEKNKWIFLQIEVADSTPLLVKSFNTSIQILRKGGVTYGSIYDAPVKKWKEAIEDALKN